MNRTTAAATCLGSRKTRVSALGYQLLLAVALLCLIPTEVWAACSEYIGRAVINEASKLKQNKDADGDFVEIKVLDSNIPASVYNTWTLEICDSSGCSTVSVSDADEVGFPWLVASGLDAVGEHLDFTGNTDILLSDGNGNAIDYFTNSNGGLITRPSCDFVYETDATTNNSTRRVQREPDGTGAWSVPTGESESETGSETNDDSDGSIPDNAPDLVVDDVTAAPGEDLVFTLTLSEAYNSDVTVSYTTLPVTAIEDTDYTGVSGTETILRDEITTKVTVPGKLGGEGTFYLVLSGAENAVITRQIGIGNIVAPLTVDHFHISFDGGASSSDNTAITCEAAAVTITAHAADHVTTVLPGAGTSISLSTSTGTGYWSQPSSGTLADNGNGNAIYTFTGAEPSVTLYLNHAVPALAPDAVNIHIDGGAGDQPGEDPHIEFIEAGFRFINAGGLAEIGNQIAGQESEDYFLQAVRTDTNTGECTGIFTAGQAVEVDLAAECLDPANCAGVQVKIADEPLETSHSNDGAGAAAYTTTTLVFGEDSSARITINYADVGQMSLHARRMIQNDDGSDSHFMLGSSNGFVVKPASFVVTNVSAGTISGTGNGTGAFIAAGDPFSVTIEARNANGGITPNFGNENDPEKVSLDFGELVFPAGGAKGDLGLGSGFSLVGPGRFENDSVTWSEVGSFTVLPRVAGGDYLGAGDVVGEISKAIGRLYPKSFRLRDSLVANSCVMGSFSYLSEPNIHIRYDLHALNRAGAVVRNYDDGLGYPTASLTINLESNDDGNDLGGRLSVAGGNWINGELIVDDAGAAIARGAGREEPLTNVAVGISIAGTDGVDIEGLNFNPDTSGDCHDIGDCNSKLLAGMLELRFGRLYLQDGHGPEFASIPMVWQTEYWNGERFILNTDDHCSELPLSAIDFVGATTVVDAGSDSISVDIGGAASVFDFSDPLEIRDCLSTTDLRFCAGRAGRTYGAPGATVTYPIDIDLSGLPWLQGDWNQDGVFSDSMFPRVNISFQHYRGHDRIIYWREVFE